LEDDIPKSLRLTKMLLELQTDSYESESEKPLKPIPESILNYYQTYVNDMFKEDGVGYETQREFEVGYDEYSNRITIPIRDDIVESFLNNDIYF
jgi:DNA primase